ncbi:hypothetical protein PG995_007646 [Apiospora arundinis]
MNPLGSASYILTRSTLAPIIDGILSKCQTLHTILSFSNRINDCDALLSATPSAYLPQMVVVVVVDVVDVVVIVAVVVAVVVVVIVQIIVSILIVIAVLAVLAVLTVLAVVVILSLRLGCLR